MGMRGFIANGFYIVCVCVRVCAQRDDLRMGLVGVGVWGTWRCFRLVVVEKEKELCRNRNITGSIVCRVIGDHGCARVSPCRDSLVALGF